MKRRAFVRMLAGLPFVAAASAFAQAARAPRRIAVLSPAAAATHKLYDEFRAALKSLGYVEGRDVQIDFRWAEGRIERLPALANELLRLSPAVIVTNGSSGVVAAMNATKTIPIVFASAGDPVGQGFVKSLRQPGGNVTGVAFNDEINVKMYELAREAMPGVRRIAVLVNDKDPATKLHLDDVPKAAKAYGLDIFAVNSNSPEAIAAAMDEALRGKAQAIVVTPISIFSSIAARIAELATKHRLPTFFSQSSFVTAGGLASYSFPLEENYRRAAVIVDKILKGEKPAEVPVELPTKYEITLNQKTAKAIGISFPTLLLLRANRIIE